MTLEEIKFIQEQFLSLRLELKQDLKDLKDHLDDRLGSHADELASHDERITAVENFTWRTTAICAGIVFLVQILINVAVEFFKR